MLLEKTFSQHQYLSEEVIKVAGELDSILMTSVVELEFIVSGLRTSELDHQLENNA